MFHKIYFQTLSRTGLMAVFVRLNRGTFEIGSMTIMYTKAEDNYTTRHLAADTKSRSIRLVPVKEKIVLWN